MINLLLQTTSQCKACLVTRPFSEEQLRSVPSLGTMLAMQSGNAHSRIEASLPLTDEEVAFRLTQSHILVLPYNYSGHSGQLELAFDCGLLPVITDVGHLRSQCDLWPTSDRDAVVSVDWSDGKFWTYQPRLMAGIRQALIRLPEFLDSCDFEARRTFRIDEHRLLLDRHVDVYTRASSR